MLRLKKYFRPKIFAKILTFFALGPIYDSVFGTNLPTCRKLIGLNTYICRYVKNDI
jgi:hypothetical protein